MNDKTAGTIICVVFLVFVLVAGLVTISYGHYEKESDYKKCMRTCINNGFYSDLKFKCIESCNKIAMCSNNTEVKP